MPFTIVRQDITRMAVDVIVNAANTQLKGGGGVCGAIFAAAGARELQAACDALAPIQPGEAVITPGFKLPAKYIIHAAGPLYRPEAPRRSEELLRDCYVNSLDLAAQNGCQSIAFPLISSGAFGYPGEAAIAVATATIRAWLQTAPGDMAVSLVVFDRESFRVSEELLGKVESYIDEHYVDDRRSQATRTLIDVECAALREADLLASDEMGPASAAPAAPMMSRQSKRVHFLRKPKAPEYLPMAASVTGIDDVLSHLDESFSETLLRLIDAKGQTDIEVYKRANLDRKLFSKIRTGNGYMPSKRTALALAIALKLSLKETGDLLARAGYALSHSQKGDVIIEYFIVNKQFDICEINEVLFKYDQPLLGG